MPVPTNFAIKRASSARRSVAMGAALVAAVSGLPSNAWAERVHQLECAPATFSTDSGTSSSEGVDYCWKFVNGCDRDVELSVIENVSHVRHSSGPVGNEPGKNTGSVCTSHPNAIAYYTLYGKPKAGWAGSVIRIGGNFCDSLGNPCKPLSVEARVDASTITFTGGGGAITYNVNGSRAAALPAGGQGSLTSRVTPNAITLTDSSRFPAGGTSNRQNISIERLSATTCSVTWTGNVSGTAGGKQRSWTQRLDGASCEISPGG